MDEREFHLVTTDEEFEEMMHECLQSDRVGLDTEGTGLHPTKSRVCGWCLAPNPQKGYYVPIFHEIGTVYDSKKAAAGIRELVDSGTKLDFWHAQFDVNMIWNEGIEFWRWRQLFDGMIAYWLVDSKRPKHGLKYVTKQLLGIDPVELWECFGHKKKPSNFVPIVKGLDPIDITVYAASDAMLTTEHCRNLENEEFFQRQLPVFQLEMATILTLAWMDRDETHINVEYVEGWRGKIEAKILELEQQIHEVSGEVFNIASTSTLSRILFKKLGLPVVQVSEKTGGPSTDDNVLEQLKDRHPVVPLLQEWRHETKVLSNYVMPYITDQEDGKTRIGYYQAATDTGRIQGRKGKFFEDGRIGFSVSTIPKVKRNGVYDPRQSITARGGFKYAAVDYVNEEMRLAANMSGEPVWLEALLNGRNLHREMACRMYGKTADEVTPDEYGAAKGMNFRYLYGGGGPWEDDYNTYYAAVPVLKKWQDAQKAYMMNHGYVQTAWGRCRRGEDLVTSGDKKKQGYAKRIAVNSPVQGSGSDALRLAINQIVLRLIHKDHPELKGNLYLKLLIHDEVVFEIADEAMTQEARDKGWTFDKILYAVCEVMESITLPGWKCPLEVDGHVGPTWSTLTGTEFELDRENKKIVYKDNKPARNVPGVTLTVRGRRVFLQAERSMLDEGNSKLFKDTLVASTETGEGGGEALAVRLQFYGSGKVHDLPGTYSLQRLKERLKQFAEVK